MSKKLSATEMTLGKVFSKEFSYYIPSYQRPYSWEKEEALALFNDIFQSVSIDNRSIKDQSEYFLGSIVLIKENELEFQIVDGQQRLTTLTILFSALRHYLPEIYKKSISALIYDEADPLAGISARYRLTLRDKDSLFFKETIQEAALIVSTSVQFKNLSDSKKKILENYQLFNELLQKLSSEEVRRIAEYLVQKCYVVAVTSFDPDSAFKIFSVMNDRGRPLEVTDILKAEVLGSIQDKEIQERYTEKWEDLEESLGRDNFVVFFSHLRMIFFKTKSKSTILKDVRSIIKSVGPVQFIDDFVAPYSSSFQCLLSKEYKSKGVDSQNINTVLKFLALVDFQDWQPVLILHFAKNSTSDVAGFVKKFERLVMALMILRIDVNKRIERFGKVLSALESKGNLFLPDSPLLLSSEEQNDILIKLDSDIYKESRIVLLVLLRLDSFLSSGGAIYEHSKLSIEHVMPQNPSDTSEWLVNWPDDDIRNTWVHRLGNLVLLDQSKNSKARNFDFEKKKKTYFSKHGVSPFVLTTGVLTENEWLLDIVTKRQEFLISKLAELWELNPEFPLSIELPEKSLRFDHDNYSWESRCGKFGLYLCNECEWTGPTDWTGESIILLSNSHEAEINILSKYKYFSKVKNWIYLPQKIKFKEETFTSNDSFGWESANHKINLLSKGKLQSEWLDEWDSIQIIHPESESVRAHLYNYNFFSSFYELMKPTISLEKCIELLGGLKSKKSLKGVDVFELNDESKISIKLSQYYPEDSSFWYGVSPSTLSKYKDESLNHLVLIVGGEGLIKLPVNLLELYLCHANKTFFENGEVKHFHIFIRKVKQGVFKLYTSAEKEEFLLNDYFIKA